MVIVKRIPKASRHQGAIGLTEIVQIFTESPNDREGWKELQCLILLLKFPYSLLLQIKMHFG